MPKGEHLSTDHQRAAAMANIRPRKLRGVSKIVGPPPPQDAPADEHASYEQKMADATLRLQRARAETEELDASKRQVELDALCRRLIPAEESRDSIEAMNLEWVAEVEQMSTAVVQALVELPASIREQVRDAINAEASAIRKRLGGDK
jgi:hypothetical protein